MRSAIGIVYFAFSVCILCLTIRCEESREHTIAKRVPGWGKRDVSSDYENVNSLLDSDKLNNLEDESQAMFGEVMKRKPGWGKRNIDDQLSEMDKRKPGWGKRFESDLIKRRPGWGKRDSGKLYSEDGLEDEMDKRRPGWGKRSEQDYILDKRRPGWGKRVPGWGKRSNDFNTCQRLEERIGLLKLQLAQILIFGLVWFLTSQSWLFNAAGGVKCVAHDNATVVEPGGSSSVIRMSTFSVANQAIEQLNFRCYEEIITGNNTS